MPRRFITALAIYSLLVLARTLGAGPLDRDHHRAYRVRSIDVDQQVFLKGQFDSSFVEARLDSIVGYTNPVAKNGSSVRRENLHYVWYKLREASTEPQRKVILRNQFGEQAWTLGGAAYLLVPVTGLRSVDQSGPLPDSADHYKCYHVLASESAPRGPSRSLTLKDAWKTEVGVAARTPRLFAVPVRKRSGDVTSDITNGATHYAIYSLESSTLEARKVLAKDQFGTRTLAVREARGLMVPSEKLSWGAVLGTTSPTRLDFGVP